MSNIPINRYIEITSSVGGSATVSRRDLILRLFVANHLLSPNAVYEFESAAAVGAFLGTSSDEYKAASKYFAWISPLTTKPKKISFANSQQVLQTSRWIGASKTISVSGVKALGDEGALTFSFGAETYTTAAITFSGVESLSAAAGAIASAINLTDVSDLVDVSVSYNATDRNFVVDSGLNDGDTFYFHSGALSDYLGLTAGRAVGGIDSAVSHVDAINTSESISNNFGSFGFLFDEELDLDTQLEIAQANAEKNIRFMFCNWFNVDHSAEEVGSTFMEVSGTTLTAMSADTADEYAWLAPAMVLAATRYERANSTVSYMYLTFDWMSAMVTDETVADLCDKYRINYNGQTQTAGTQFIFYQRGVIGGSTSMPTDINVYCNEMWLKDVVTVNLMNLFIALPKISANTKGCATLLTGVQGAVTDALNNGVISVGKTLTELQKATITELAAQYTDDDSAALVWQQVNAIGYYLAAAIESKSTTDGRTEYYFVWLLIYSKDDVIRSAEGSHVMI